MPRSESCFFSKQSCSAQARLGESTGSVHEAAKRSATRWNGLRCSGCRKRHATSLRRDSEYCTVALLSDELLLAGVLIRLALCRYAALSQRRTSDNLSRCGQELHLTSGNQMPLVLAGCRGCLHGSSSAQPSDYPGCREQKPSLTAPRPGLPVVHTQVASHTVSHTGAVREGFCSRHHCACV